MNIRLIIAEIQQEIRSAAAFMQQIFLLFSDNFQLLEKRIITHDI